MILYIFNISKFLLFIPHGSYFISLKLWDLLQISLGCIIPKDNKQKYHYNQPINRTMKGVKINNYIDNRIVLSGRKLKNQVQTLIQSHRPRPLVIRHLNYFQQQQDALQTEQKETLKAVELKVNKKNKKKSKNINNIEVKQSLNQKQQKKQKLNKQSSKRILSAKKRSAQSSPSKNSEEKFNDTEKKVKSNHKNTEGLGKRSKSAIIKRNKSPSNLGLQLQKKKFNQTNMKINIDVKRQTDMPKKKNSRKEKKVSSGVKNPKQIKKNMSSVNITERKKYSQKQSGLKTSRPNSKSYLSNTKHSQSKPVSARENKKQQANLNKKLFDSKQTKREKQHITLEQLLNIQKNDFKIKDAIHKLEEAINSTSSKKKLSQKIQFIAEKLKQINSQKSSSEEQESIEQVHLNQNENAEKSQHKINNQTHRSVQQFSPHQQVYLSSQQKQKQKESKNKFTNSKIAKDIMQFQEDKKHKQFQPEPCQQKNQLNNLRITPIDILTEKDKKAEEFQREIDSKIQLKRDMYKKDPDNARGFLQRQNGIYNRENQEQNPLIGRKTGTDAYLDLVDYDSINSVKSNQSNDKKQQINQLKRFQQQSDEMMKKIKSLQMKKKSSEEQVSAQQNEQNISQTVAQTKQVTADGKASPRSLQLNNYAFEKYPSAQSLRSPKFNSDQIIQVIRLKEKIQTDRHEKLSELVNVMFDKQLVSPKTYSLHIQSLRQQQQQNNQVLDNYKKHAEELAQLLNEIKKQKQEISNIDEMIRSQKWNQAINVIKSNQKVVNNKAKQVSDIVDSHVKNYYAFQTQNKAQKKLNKQNISKEQEEAVYYEGQDSQPSDTGFKLIQVQNEQQQQFQKSAESNKLIKIDESDHASQKRQRGFDSNLFFIKQYCIALCQFVRDNHKQDFRKRIGIPMQYDLQKLLKCFRTNRDGSPASAINSLCQDLSYHDCQFHYNEAPISQQIFGQFNKIYPSIKNYLKEETQDAGLQGIFLKSIYDALNESISIQKPGSFNGKALPWTANSKHLKNLKNSLKNSEEQKLKNQQSQDLIFGIAIARIIQWGSCLCGFIPDTVQLENTEIDEQYINHIRETRTALLLEKMLADQQASMYRTQLEETQVQLYIEHIVFQEIINEIVQDMKKIVFRQTIRSLDY